jgi:hypothetical protein
VGRWVGPRQIAGHPLIDELSGDGNTDCFLDYSIVLDDKLLLGLSYDRCRTLLNLTAQIIGALKRLD